MNTHMMTKRLQVLLEDEELAMIKRAARRRRQTVAEWVRSALRAAHEAEADTSPVDKLRILQRATAHAFPTGSMEEMLADIERSYGNAP